jgi:hypothetical protein
MMARKIPERIIKRLINWLSERCWLRKSAPLSNTILKRYLSIKEPTSTRKMTNKTEKKSNL